MMSLNFLQIIVSISESCICWNLDYLEVSTFEYLSLKVSIVEQEKSPSLCLLVAMNNEHMRVE